MLKGNICAYASVTKEGKTSQLATDEWFLKCPGWFSWCLCQSDSITLAGMIYRAEPEWLQDF